MNTLLIIILSLSLATSAATKHDAGIRLVRPVEPVIVDVVDEPQPEAQAVTAPDPAASLPDWMFVGEETPTIGEACEMFVDKQCATDMRPHINGE